MRARLIELQNEADSLQAGVAAGRLAPEPNLRGWAALLPLEPKRVGEGLREAHLSVLRGARGQLVLGSLAQLWGAARSLADAFEDAESRAICSELMDRAAAIDEGPRRFADLPARTAIMGIVNVTPDSFSDGGLHATAEAAIAHGVKLAEEGADLLDIGGESTRPGAAAVGAAEEMARVVPVIRELSRRVKIPLSVDTVKSEVAEAALDAGATIVNDVSGLQRDPRIAQVAASRGAALILMHMRGTPADMQSRASYADLHGEVLAELEIALRAAGLPRERVAIDPGLGFAKTAEHNLLLLRRQRELLQLGHALLIGASRKSFIGKLTGRPAPERLHGSTAAAVVAALNGASIVRVHDVAASREALAVADAIRSAR